MFSVKASDHSGIFAPSRVKNLQIHHLQVTCCTLEITAENFLISTSVKYRHQKKMYRHSEYFIWKKV